jgi:hypothetical protein
MGLLASCTLVTGALGVRKLLVVPESKIAHLFVARDRHRQAPPTTEWLRMTVCCGSACCCFFGQKLDITSAVAN